MVLAPTGFLTGAMWNWPKVYKDFAKMHMEGKSIAGLHRGGLKEGIVKLAPYGAAVSEEAKTKTEAVLADFMDEDGFDIFKGPLKSNSGEVIIQEGAVLKQQDPILESMNYLVEGVVGSIPAM
jgi:simple sugar transport system substrate-binding protein